MGGEIFSPNEAPNVALDTLDSHKTPFAKTAKKYDIIVCCLPSCGSVKKAAISRLLQ